MPANEGPMKTPRAIDLRLLQYFLKTVEEGGITRAAAALNIAQPTLSKAIRLLEYQLGATLLERGPQGVVPTAIGERLLRHARSIMAQVHDAAAQIEAMRLGEAGSVRIGAGPSWVRRLLPEAVADALKERPDLEISVFGGYDESLLGRLFEGDLDMVVAEMPMEFDGETFEAEELTDDDLMVCAREGHPLVGRKELEMTEILPHRWVLPSQNTLARRKFEGKLLSLGLPSPAAVVNSNSMTFILTLLRASDALTYTTLSSLKSFEGRAIRSLDVPALRAVRRAGVIVRRPRLLSPAGEYLVSLLRARCAGQRN
ncbi:MAG: LysR family transcriptional regulator [Acuticoccus sp.]